MSTLARPALATGALPTMPARLLGRASGAALAIFVRPWLAVALVALVVALPLYLVTASTFDDTNARLESSRQAEQARAAETAAKIVEDRVGGIQTDLAAVASSRFMQSAVTTGDAVALGALVTELRATIGIEHETLAVFVENTRGSLLAIDPPDQTLIGRDFSQRDYFIGVSRGWIPFVSEAFQAAIQGNPATTVVAVPVFGDDDRPVGVFGAAVDFSLAADWLTPLSGYRDVYVLDRKGR
jgi:C4-dicarboxylate-specific signal transduction histidine kinase